MSSNSAPGADPDDIDAGEDGAAGRGIAPLILVPWPGADSMARVPSMAPRRSPMLTKPWPSSPKPWVRSTVNPAPSSDTSKWRTSSSSHTRTLAVAPSPACLPAFCSASRQQKYTAASISAGCGRVATVDGRRQRGPAAGRGQRLGQAAADEERREDPVGQGPELLDGVLDVGPQLVHHLDGGGRVVLHGVLGQAELDGQGHEVLLGSVVQVALQLAALGIAGGDDAGPAGPQLARWPSAARPATPAARSRAACCGGRGRPGGPVRRGRGRPPR